VVVSAMHYVFVVGQRLRANAQPVAEGSPAAGKI